MKQRSRAQMRQASYHEAGHAVMHALLHLSFRHATIIANAKEGSAGHVAFRKVPPWIMAQAEYGTPWEHPRVVSRALNEICALKAGHIAERCVTKRTNHYGASSDRRQAYDWLNILAPTSDRHEWLALNRWLDLRTRRLVQGHWKAIETVAKALLERNSLSSAEIRSCIAEVDRLPQAPTPPTNEELASIALQLADMSPERANQELDDMPPGERRIWQKVRRDLASGKIVLKKEGRNSVRVIISKAGHTQRTRGTHGTTR